ncbi:DNA ligase [Escherichia phage K1F]|uniref:DNA ligase n=1 Tax=Escherichia phage K1F TaxID=344021 RepID=Q3YJZ5_BPK1F|nr:DNA ligase [Escherichia phage K1F]YP_424920.1 DNA ligase [Escherichia phage K1F]AAZ72970.1 ligase [Escherichia phage K1F]CAJ29351.1 gp1.3 protein [Escherichia phage K1F]
MTTIKTNPHRAVDYSESGVKKALAAAGSLEAEVKYDGVRLNLPVLREGETYWLSRESKPLPALEWMNSELGNAWTQADWRWFLRQAGYEGVGLMIDGEVMVKGVDFNTSSGLIRTKWLKPSNEEFAECYPGRGNKVPFWVARSRLKVVVYGVVDMTTIADPKAEGPIHSVTRLKAEAIVPLLQKYFPEIDWVLSESHTVFNLESLRDLYEEKRADGHEGLVVKDPLGKYKRGKKSGMWKMKPSEEADGHVVRPVWGTEGLANEGMVIGFDVMLENGMEVSATNISRALMSEFTENVKSDPDYYKGWACQITYMEETPDGSLRHPSFDQWRGTEDNPTIKS